MRTRETVTDALGLVTLLIGALSAARGDRPRSSAAAVGRSAPVLIVLGSLLLGGIAGSLVDIEARLERFGDWLRRRLTRITGRQLDGASQEAAPERFIEGFVTASLVFCVGPLTILGALSDGLGLGPNQLMLKATLDGFAAIAFAASLGLGVMASAVAVAVVQGALDPGRLPDRGLPARGAPGRDHRQPADCCCSGVGLRLLRIQPVPVGNLLPALLVAPLLVAAVAALR